MKGIVATGLVYFAALATATPALLQRDPGTPPAGADPRCDTSDKSPGVSNIQIAAKGLQDRGGVCTHNGGDATQELHEDGLRVYLHGKAGTQDCAKIGDALNQIVAYCSKDLAGDVRAGGSAWVGDQALGLYVDVSK